MHHAHPTEPDEHDLIASMRRRKAKGLRDFFLRFHAPLLAHALRLGIPSGGRDEFVTEFLDDAALWLIDDRNPMPRSLLHYLKRGLKYRMLNRARSDSRRNRVYQSAASARRIGGEQLVATTYSVAVLRSSEGEYQEEATLSPPLRRLATVLDAEVSPNERQLLLWMSQRLSTEEIARSLGVRREAAKARIHRLRRRLSKVVVSRAVTPQDRRELLSLLANTRHLSAADRKLLTTEMERPGVA